MDYIINPENYKTDWLSYWQPNHLVSVCNSCRKNFSIFVRKHHCRKCGKIFCEKCWGTTMYLDIYKKDVPVCNICYENSN